MGDQSDQSGLMSVRNALLHSARSFRNSLSNLLVDASVDSSDEEDEHNHKQRGKEGEARGGSPARENAPILSPASQRRAKLKRLFSQGVSKVVVQKAKELDEATTIASYFVQDAFAGRLEHGLAMTSKKGPLIFGAFRVQTSDLWLKFVILANVTHMLLAFMEDTAEPRLVELVLLSVYIVDIGLKCLYMGLGKFMSKPWQKMLLWVVLALLVDVFLPVRLTRPLRPAILLLRVRSVRRFFTVCRDMMPGFLRVCLPLVFFLLLSSNFASMVFGNKVTSLSTPRHAAYSIWILMVCAENYVELVQAGERDPVFLLFFLVILIVGNIFLLSLLMGVTFDVFIEHTQKQVKSERLKELQGLTRAFAAMDPEGTGQISMVVFDKFMGHLMPRISRQERVLYFELAADFSDSVDLLSFLDLRRVLTYDFVHTFQSPQQSGARWSAWAKRQLQRRVVGHLVSSAVVLDCILLSYGPEKQGLARALGGICTSILLGEAFLIFLGGWSEWYRSRSGHECISVIAVLVEALLRLGTAAMGGWGVGCLGLPAATLMGIFSRPVCALSTLVAGGWTIYAMRLVRCWRLVTLNDGLHEYVSTFFHIFPIFLQTLGFAAIIAYSFAMLAADISRGTVPAFSTPGRAFMTQTQLFFGVDFSTVVEDSMERMGSWCIIFFMAYYVIGCLIVFNLINAITIQFYSETLNSKKCRKVQEDLNADAQLKDALTTRLKRNSVLRMWGKKTAQDCYNVTLKRKAQSATATELRRILGGEQKLTEKELAKCQKYTTVDLKSALRLHSSNETADFERHFYAKIKASALPDCFLSYNDGDAIISFGDTPGCAYFVHSGNVRLESWEGEILEIKEPGDLFGEVSLLSDLPHGVKAVADGPCECLRTTREMFEAVQSSAEALGHLALRMRRTNSFRHHVAASSRSSFPRGWAPLTDFGGSTSSFVSTPLSETQGSSQRGFTDLYDCNMGSQGSGSYSSPRHRRSRPVDVVDTPPHK